MTTEMVPEWPEVSLDTSCYSEPFLCYFVIGNRYRDLVGDEVESMDVLPSGDELLLSEDERRFKLLLSEDSSEDEPVSYTHLTLPTKA